jgi:exonuclease VII small subunit
MVRILFLVVFMFSFLASAQKKIEISLEGFVNDFSSKEKLFGASLYLFQDGRMVSKSLSDVKGNYFISGNISTKTPFDIMVSKPGFITKKVLLDFKDLKVQNPNGILQAMEELVIELFEIKDGVDLGFIKNSYAEKFHWDASRNLAVPDEKFKKEVEDKVLLAYSKMSDLNKSETFKKKMNSALKENDFQEAMIHVDSALFYNNNDASLINKKAQIESSILKQAKDLEKRAEFDGLKEQGDLAYASGDYITAEGFYKDALALFGNNQIKYKLTKIEEYKVRISQLESNKEKLNQLRVSADSLISIGEYDGAIVKLREIQFLDPNQRMKIQSEMKEIKKQKKNSNYEGTIQKYIELANRLENSKDSLDASLLFYERAENSIKNLSNQVLIDKYKIQVRDGIESVRVKKSKEREAFYQQLEKANSNFLKGPDFYDKALKILDSDLMKPYRNEPEMTKLKNRILSMDQFYKLKNTAFTNYTKNTTNAISDLKKALKIGKDNYSVTPKADLSEIRDSLQSWNGNSSLSSSSQGSTVSGYNSSGTVVRTPGMLHSGSDVDAYNDLALTMERKKSDPLEDLQRVKNEIDYEIYFKNTVDAVRNEKSADEMKFFQNEIEIKEREVALQKIELQKEQDKERQNLESAVKNRNEYALFQQEASAEQIKKWNDEKDYLIELELLNQARRNQSFEEKNRIHENERILLLEENDIASEERQYKNQDHLLKLDRDRFIKDSLAKVGGEERALEVEKLKSFKPDYQTQPNFLKNEDGVLFPPNAVTEGIYKIQNSKGFVITVIVQRVVVDSNGYGVVYEKTTMENGTSSYSRNGATITEYIWFNESMGQNVIKN